MKKLVVLLVVLLATLTVLCQGLPTFYCCTNVSYVIPQSGTTKLSPAMFGGITWKAQDRIISRENSTVKSFVLIDYVWGFASDSSRGKIWNMTDDNKEYTIVYTYEDGHSYEETIKVLPRTFSRMMPKGKTTKFNIYEQSTSGTMSNFIQKAGDLIESMKDGIGNFVKTDKGKQVNNLQWSNISYNSMPWDQAVNYCKNLNEGGYNDWRLPTIDELRTLIKNCYETEAGGKCTVKNDCLSMDCFDENYCNGCSQRNNYNVYNGGYYSKLGDDGDVTLWSSSNLLNNASYAWRVSFDVAMVYLGDKSNEFGFKVRCVR
ncbi:DUF1566 domain-containing protein [bacterium]|nr:DUF1566 domain-containing protein [bacterium]